MGVKSYKCPSCGSDITFNPTIQKWTCSSCKSDYSKQELDNFFDNKNLAGVASSFLSDSADNSHIENMSSYNCSNCGGEIIAEDTLVATFCPYCKSPSIIKSKLQGEFNPDYILPFTISEQESREIYQKYIKKKLFAPREFVNKNVIDEIKGIYAPFWLFDVDIKGDITGEGIIITRWSDEDYDYVKKDYYDFERAGENYYSKIPVDSATKMDDELMRYIEPYDYSTMRKFSMDYMSGFFAERFDVPISECQPVAEERAEEFFTARLMDTVDMYDIKSLDAKNFNIRDTKNSYAMLPVYYIANNYKGEMCDFMINGQTGKVYGRPPISIPRAVGFTMLVFFVSYLILVLGGTIYATLQ